MLSPGRALPFAFALTALAGLVPGCDLLLPYETAPADSAAAGDAAGDAAADARQDTGPVPPPDAAPPPDGGCRPGLTRCNGVCVNTSRNWKHCGGCGHRCTAATDCKEPACVEGKCTKKNAPDGTTKCNNSTGRCAGGTCCTGCIQNGRCIPLGINDTACGTGGRPCRDCTKGWSYCKKYKCIAGSCAPLPRNDGQSCTASGRPGQCASMKCCTGCTKPTPTLTKCVDFAQQDRSQCGKAGANCAPCPDNQYCNNGTCN